jgi:putative addiction module component (TIGR02574 family)
MTKNSHFDFSNLSPSERLELAQDLWDSVDSAAGLDVLPLTDEQREELEHRLTEYKANPNAGSPWSEVRERLLGQLRGRRNPGA